MECRPTDAYGPAPERRNPRPQRDCASPQLLFSVTAAAAATAATADVALATFTRHDGGRKKMFRDYIKGDFFLHDQIYNNNNDTGRDEISRSPIAARSFL